MSSRMLIIFLAVLVVLIAIIVSQRHPAPRSEAGSAPGDPVLPELDLNQVAGITMTSGEQTVTLKKLEENWVVTTLYNFPADFNRIANMLRKLGDLTVGQLMHGGEDSLAEFGLMATATGENQSLLVDLSDASQQKLAQISLGTERRPPSQEGFGVYHEGRYLRVGEGPVVLVTESMREATTKSEDWIEHELVDAQFADVEEITVGSSSSSYTVRVTGEKNYEMAGLPEGKEIDTGKAARLRRALQRLRCTSVADPSLSDQETGLDNPSTFTLKTKDGFQYMVSLGKKTGEGEHYARVSVASFETPPPSREEAASSIPPDQFEEKVDPSASPNGETVPGKSREERIEEEYQKQIKVHREKMTENKKKAEELNKRLALWTYIIGDYNAESMLLAQDEIIKKPAANAGEGKAEPVSK